MTTRKRWGPPLLLAALALLSVPSVAQQFTFSVDVPTALGGTTYQAFQAINYSGGVYSLGYGMAVFGAGTHIDAIAILPDESVLFSVDAPTAAYGPADIIRRSPPGPPPTYSLYKSAASMGLSAGANIDALAVHPTSGNLLISFDAPETVGATTFMPADIAEVGATLTMFFDASTKSVPDSINTVGYECKIVNTRPVQYFNFDAPVSLGGSVRLPGDIAYRTELPDQWNPNYFRDPAFPPGSLMTDFYFALPPPSPVPDGDQTGAGEDPLQAEKRNGGADMYVSYSRTCFTGGGWYNIIYGDIAGFSADEYTVTGSVCDFDPDNSGDQVIAGIPSGNFWFLVVGSNGGTSEGSWGSDYMGGAYHERNGTGYSGQCGSLRKDTSAICP